eukprot:4033336-Pleurochrysis_carterae.AAC.1
MRRVYTRHACASALACLRARVRDCALRPWVACSVRARACPLCRPRAAPRTRVRPPSCVVSALCRDPACACGRSAGWSGHGGEREGAWGVIGATAAGPFAPLDDHHRELRSLPCTERLRRCLPDPHPNRP